MQYHRHGILFVILAIVYSVSLAGSTAQAQPGCDGFPLLPEHNIPLFGVAASTTAEPPAFWLGGWPGGDCFPTSGNTVGGVYVDDGTATVLYGVTDAVSIWSLFTTPLDPTAIYDFEFAGTEICFAGADIKCYSECPFTLHVAFAVSDEAVATAWFDDFAEFPLESPPISVGLTAGCDPPPGYTDCVVALSVLTEQGRLHMIYEGIDHDNYIAGDIVRDALTFSNGFNSGVMIVRGTYPDVVVDVIKPSVGGNPTVVSYPIGSFYNGWEVSPTGITFNPDGSAVVIPLGTNLNVEQMGTKDTGATYNFEPCNPGIIGENMGWDFAALQCAAIEIPGGGLVRGLRRDDIFAARPQMDLWDPPVDKSAAAGGDTITLMSTHDDPTNGPGEPHYFGDFQDFAGLPDWNGWTSVDNNAPDYGSFGAIWPVLEDLDLFGGQFRNAVAFVDDGVVVPGTGGSPCITWCYGPSGWVLNVAGGLGAGGGRLDNEVVSPVMFWPDPAHDELFIEFDLYLHEPLLDTADRAYGTVRVRSRQTGGDWSQWRSHGQGYYSGVPSRLRHRDRLTTLLVDDVDEVQVALGVYEPEDYVGVGGGGGDPSPAPYFDNIRIVTAPSVGPHFHADEADQAQDAFPADGGLNYTVLGNNHVPFDRARSTGLPAEVYVNTPGDQVRVRIRPYRGSALVAPPELHYRLKPNPLFDPFRLPAWPEVGAVAGTLVPAAFADGAMWEFGLPDPDLLYPGDVLHYYFRAEDGTGVAIMPPDTTGFSFFPGDTGYAQNRYPTKYTVRALPTMFTAVEGEQPKILFWNDGGNADEENEWLTALANLGYEEGVDFDIYTTKAASSGVGSGLGGRATLAQIEHYETILYTAGDQARFTMGSLSNGQPVDDVTLLTNWLTGGGNLLAVGDNLAWDLVHGNGGVFVTDWLGVTLDAQNVLPLVGATTNQWVLPEAGNTPGLSVSFMAAAGKGPQVWFDAVQPQPGTEVVAVFDGPPTGFAAVTAQVVGASKVVYSPISFESWRSPPGWTSSVAARTMALDEFLGWFGNTPGGSPSDVPGTPREFAVQAAPNPFNPRVKISWTLPRSGHLRIRVHDLRGALVRTLIDDAVDAKSGEVVWQGELEDGAAAPSGVYFYEAVAGGEVRSGKLMLLK